MPLTAGYTKPVNQTNSRTTQPTVGTNDVDDDGDVDDGNDYDDDDVVG